VKEPHQRSGAKREPCAAWQNRERDRQYREQERMRHAGQTYTMPMVEPSATATATVPFTVPRMASAIFSPVARRDFQKRRSAVTKTRFANDAPLRKFQNSATSVIREQK
jgi:hypothetical protein